MNRRTFLAGSASGTLALSQTSSSPKRIAAIITEYRLNSHADVIVGKYLEGFKQNGQPPYPRSKIVSMCTEQVPKNDMSRDMAKKHNVPIFRTVADALTLGGEKLAVDGVLLIGEHGDYPSNDKTQKLYPRYEMFLKITDLFRQTGRSVPVFNDKHLSWSFRQAKRMVDISRELRFPMLAGSSVPVAFRVPAVDAPFGARQSHAVAIGYGGLEVYGFHMLEGLQAMVDRRRGGETGVRTVQCLEGDACWGFLEENGWARKLFEQALSHSKTRKPGNPRELAKGPAVFVIDYSDGLKGAGFMMTGVVDDFTVAVDVEGRAEPASTLMNLQSGRPYHHFECLVKNIEKMFETGKPPYPVERTLLTSGILDFALDSRIQEHKKIDTPQLAQIRYQTPNASHYCTEGWS